MTRLFSSLMIAITLIFVPVKKSEAAVGGLVSLAVSVPALIAFGGVSTVVGGVSMYIGNRTDNFDKGFILFFGGAALFLLGVVFLDGNQVIGFNEVNDRMPHLKGVSAEDLATYNSELDQLNAIHKEISDEIATDMNVDPKARWAEMKDYVSPATMKIAAINSDLLLKSLQKK